MEYQAFGFFCLFFFFFRNSTCRDNLLSELQFQFYFYINVTELVDQLYVFVLCSAVCQIYTNVVCFPFSLQLNNQFVFCFDFSVPSFTFTPTGIYLHFSPLLCYLSMCLWYFFSFSDITNQPSCSEGLFLSNVINDRYHYLLSKQCAFALWLTMFSVCVYHFIAHHSTPACHFVA